MPWADPSQCERLRRPHENYQDFYGRTLRRFVQESLAVVSCRSLAPARENEWRQREAALVGIIISCVSPMQRAAILDQWEAFLSRKNRSLRRG